MSYFCQFCDKEMVFEQSVVYEKSFITCGATACVAAATKASEDITTGVKNQTARLLIFKSATPEDSSTWRIVPKKQYPEYIHDDEVLHALFEGCVVGLQPDEDTPAEMYYCARNVEEVLQAIRAADKGV